MIYKARLNGKPHFSPGPNLIAHFSDCGCDFVRTVSYAPWISYNLMDGVVSCSRCGFKDIYPTPSVSAEQKDYYYLDHEAIGDDINRFKLAHLNCTEKEKPECQLVQIS